ncbi:MAG TPA: hypothetical protein VGK19_15330 [Capsulimonadaceae bacterium]
MILWKKNQGCKTAWDEMDGSARVRYCHECKHNVYDIAGMSHEEGVAFVARMEGLDRVTLRRRPDGKVVSVEAVIRAARSWRRVAGSLAAMLAIGAVLTASVPAPVFAPVPQEVGIARQRLYHRAHRHSKPAKLAPVAAVPVKPSKHVR